MSDIAIRISNLGKTYKISHLGPRWRRQRILQEELVNWLKRPFRSSTRQSDETLWALKDVTFEVRQGEVLGILGANGAGKSTLLKVLARITEPSHGYADIFGRAGSLLEVGTGFHSELTGRENIYVNGAVLGMSRVEINRKFNEIVQFAGIEMFLDTPVKRYSTGMEMRLAFSVAAHLDPEILLIDEVLAVGDAAFRKKSLAKMKEVAKSGRTVLFVSHNMAAVSSLCTKAIVLQKGLLEIPPSEVGLAIEHYLKQADLPANPDLWERSDRIGQGRLRISDFGIFDEHGAPLETAACGRPLELRLQYRSEQLGDPKNVEATISIKSPQGFTLIQLDSLSVQGLFFSLPAQGYIACRLNKFPLAPGHVRLTFRLAQEGILQDLIEDAVDLNVESGDFYGTGAISKKTVGVLVEQDWSAGP